MTKKPAGWPSIIRPFEQFATLYRFAFFLLPFLHSFNTVMAQQIQFEHLTVDNGLAHSDAMDVLQDRDGFIWIATNNGIDRYDGYDLKHYRLPQSNATGVTSNRVHVLFVDLNGVLWAGTENSGIYYYDHRMDQFYQPTFTVNNSSPEQLLKKVNSANVKSIVMDQQHRMWVATMNYGVFCLQTGGIGKISSIKKVNQGTAGDFNYHATAVFATEPGQVWIGTLDKGLWLIESKKQPRDDQYTATETHYIPEKNIRVIQQDPKDGNIWMASDHSIYMIRLDSSGGHQIKKLPGSFYDIQCLYSDSFGHLWIGSNIGLKMIENIAHYLNAPVSENIHQYSPTDSDPSGINSSRIHRIMQDNFGNLWLATSDGGVNKIRLQTKGFHNLHRSVSKKTGLASQFVNAIARDERRQTVWIGTRKGYSVFNEQSGRYDNFLTTQGSEKGKGIEVSAFCKVGNSMWVGTRYSGLYLAKTDPLQNPILFGRQAGLPAWGHISIETIITDNKGQVWVGTFGAGLILFSKEGKFVRSYSRSNGALLSNDVSFLLYDPLRDVIWVSSLDQGVLKMQEQNGVLQLRKQFKHDPGDNNSLKVNFAWPLARDQAGNIWIGTIGGGLHKVETVNGSDVLRRFQHLIPDSDIESILVDKKGNLWIAGMGLKKFNPKTGELLNFDVNDGLQSNSFKVGSAFLSNTGTMYFGGTNGMTWFRPDEIRPSPPPMVRITAMRVINKSQKATSGKPGSSMTIKSFSEADGVIIHADENDFLFEFVGLNYVNARKQSYAYMLKGYSKNWIQLPEGQRTASFANLPAGDYVFRVKASNGEGIWSASAASVRVTVLPPWWQTWWALLFYLFIFLAALFWYRALTINRLVLENKLAFEKLKSESEQKIAEMKANFFTGVSHELRTPLTLILGPMEELARSYSESGVMHEKILMMHKQSRKLLRLVNQLLSFRKLETGTVQLSATCQDMVELIVEVFSFFKIKADELDLNYQLDVPSHPVNMYFDHEKLEVIMTNLLSNAFKYSKPGGTINLSATIVGNPECDAVLQHKKLVDHYLEISVTDTGTGIDSNDQKNIFDPYFQASNNISFLSGSGIGLALVKEFVERHSGEITFKSNLGSGSTFIVRIPFGKKHLPDSDLAPAAALTEILPQHPVVKKESTEQKLQKHEMYKLLIVEDNAELRDYLYYLFSDQYQVFLCADGAAGWAKTTEILPDLILSDVNMPEMNGLELSKKIKQNQKTTHIPVILLTALAAAAQEVEGLDTGADDYIIKPFNEDILRAKVHTTLHNRGRLQQYYQRQILLQPNQILIADEDKLFLEKAMGIVEANLHNREFNVQLLVNDMHMSQSVFYRRIKTITGQTAIEFIRDIRLKNAAQLLKNPYIRISEVASMVGMDDVRNFRIFFQKRFDMLPSVYAKTFRQKAVPPESGSTTDL